MAVGDRIYVTPQPTIADLFDATLIYNKGDIVYHLNTLYTRNLTATAALAWDATKWDEVIATLGFVKLNGDPKASQKVNGAITFSNDGCAAVQIEIANETDPLISAKKPGFGPDTLVEYDGTHTADWINYLNWAVGFNNDTVPELDDSKNQYVRVTMSDDVDFKASKWDTTLTDEVTSEAVRFKMFYRTVYSADGNASLNQYLGGYLYKTVKLAGVTNPFPKGWYAGRRKDDTLYTKKIYAVANDINYAKITGNKVQIGQGSEVKDWTGYSTNAAIAIGKNSSTCYSDQIVIGSNSSIAESSGTQYSTIIGSNNKNLIHYQSILIGSYANLKGKGNNTIAIGPNIECGTSGTGTANGNTCIGYAIRSYGQNNIAIGDSSKTLGEDSDYKDVQYAIALGRTAYAMSDNATAIGSYSSTKRGGAIAIGYNAYSDLENSVAIGKSIRAGYKEYVIGTANTSGRSDRNISTKWTSGSDYTKGTVVYSRNNPASNDYHVYRAKNDITGSTTYPSMDSTNWQDLAYNSSEYPYRFAVVLNDTQFQVEQTGKAMIRTGLKVGYLNTDENIYGYNLCTGSSCKILGSSANYCFAGGNGCQIKNSSYYVLCYGNNNEVDASGTICIGLRNQILANSNTATTIGYHNYVDIYSSSAVALGYFNSIDQYSNNSVAIGDNNSINNDSTVNQTCFAFGKKNQSNSNGFMALGNENTVAYTGAFAFGDHLKASGTALVLGYNYYLNDAPHPVWDNTTTYMMNDIVLYRGNNTYYRSKVDNNVGITPTTTASWLTLEITDARIDKHVIIGLDTKKVLDANHDGDVRVYNDVYINDGSTGAKKVANENQISDAFSEASTYATGTFCIYKNVLYKAIADVTAGPWDATKWVSTKITDELGGGGGSSVIIDTATGTKYKVIATNGLIGLEEVV